MTVTLDCTIEGYCSQPNAIADEKRHHQRLRILASAFALTIYASLSPFGNAEYNHQLARNVAAIQPAFPRLAFRIVL